MSGPDSIKVCTKCGDPKPTSDYYSGKQPCKECTKKRRRERYAADSKRGLEINARYVARNPEKIRAYKARWHMENAELVRQRARDWAASNPERQKANLARSFARRRALERSVPGTFDAESMRQMYEDQDGLCAYCEVPLHGRFHVEHMVPLSRGGSNYWHNVALACPECNATKGNKTVKEFFDVLKEVQDQRM